MTSVHAEMQINHMLPPLPPQLMIFVYGNTIPAQMRSSEFALIDSQVNPYGSGVLNGWNEAGDYVTNGTSYAPPSFVPDFSTFRNCVCESPLLQLPLQLNSQKLPIPAFSPVNRKRTLEEESSKSIPRTKRRNSVKGILEHYSEHCRVPAMKRIQKLGDKITILQKLVCPYGKTDTTSVLQEAEIYIKQLHAKISNMYELLSENAAATLPQLDTLRGMRNMSTDLRQRGLCLMPISITQDLTTCNNNDTTLRRRR